MQVNNIKTTNTFFTSRNNPIPTETFISAVGKVTMSEASTDDITSVAKIIRHWQMISFKRANFCGPGAEEAKEAYKKINKNSWLKDITQYLKSILDKPDGNSSILVAKNEDGKVIGYATMEGIQGTKGKIGVIENIYLDWKYRESNLGHYLLYKIIQTGRNQFTDIITKSPSIGKSDIYHELGFRYLPTESSDVKYLNQKYHEGGDCQNWMRKNINYYL